MAHDSRLYLSVCRKTTESDRGEGGSKEVGKRYQFPSTLGRETEAKAHPTKAKIKAKIRGWKGKLQLSNYLDRQGSCWKASIRLLTLLIRLPSYSGLAQQLVTA